jgi:hypothetical protein
MTGSARIARAAVAAGLLIASCLGVEPVHAAGALAIGTCGAYGLSYDYGESQAASKAALGQCSGECKLAAAMHNTCAALAIDGHNACGAFGYAAGPRLGQAQNTALLYCYRNGGRDCVIRAWVCDGKG